MDRKEEDKLKWQQRMKKYDDKPQGRRKKKREVEWQENLTD